jgi:hypothetical protein
LESLIGQWQNKARVMNSCLQVSCAWRTQAYTALLNMLNNAKRIGENIFIKLARLMDYLFLSLPNSTTERAITDGLYKAIYCQCRLSTLTGLP